MNTIYSLVWNSSIRALVVGSEFARRARKSGCARKLACVAMLAAANGVAFAGSGHPGGDVLLCDEAHVTVAASGEVTCNPDTSVEATGHDVVAAPARIAGAGRAINETYVSMSSSGAAANAAANKDAMALGGGTEAMGTHSVALGSSAKAMAQDTMALGFNSRATATGGLAIGGGFVSMDKGDNVAGSGGMFGIAIGSGARVEMDYLGEDYQGGTFTGAANGVAIGKDSWAAGKDSAAIGSGSEALEAYTVSIGSNGIRRRLVNVANGMIATDAVTIDQADAILGVFSDNARFEDGVLVPLSFKVQDKSHDTVSGAIEALDQGIDEVNDRIDKIGTGGGDSGLIGLEGDAVKIGASSTVTEIDFSGDGVAARTLKGVAGGDVKAGSTEAVNGGQLYTTNEAVSTNATNISTNTADITTNTTNIATNTTNISGLAGRVDGVDVTLTQHATTLGDHTNLIEGLTTGLESTNERIDNLDTGAGDSGLIGLEGDALKIGASSTVTEIDFSGDGVAARTLKGVAGGDVKAGSTEAVNGGQLYTTNEAVSTNATNIVTNTADITTNTTNIATNTTDITTNTTNIATNTTNISDLAGRVDGVDGTLTQHATTLGDHTNLIEGLTTGLESTNERIDNLDTGAGDSGLIVAEGDAVKIGASSTVTEIDFSGDGVAARTLKGVAGGDVKAGSTEAVNGGQLYTTNEAVSTNATNISTNTADITTNTTNIATNTTNISGLAGRVDGVDVTLTQHATTLGDHTNLIEGLTTGLESTNERIDNLDTGAGDSGLIVAEDGAVKIGASSKVTEIDFSGDGVAARTLKGVAGGDVKAGSTEAVNGGQLYTTNEAVSTNATNISTNTADITTNATNIATNTTNISGLAGRVDGVDVTLAQHNGRMDGLAQDIKATNDRIDGLPDNPGVPGDQLVGEGADGSLSIGANVGGSLVNMAGSAGDRVLTGVAGGRVEANSNDAVNGHQVAEIRDQLEKEIGTIGDRVTQIEQGEVAPPTAPAPAPGDGDYVTAAQLEEQMGQAKSYTDSRMEALSGSIDTLRQDVDARFKAQDQRISRIGAMGAAMTQMTSSMAATRGENRVGAGIGTQGGQRAISVGYQRVVEKANAAITIGGSFSNGESQMGVGVGFGF